MFDRLDSRADVLAQVLQALGETLDLAPRWLAAGQFADGRAFLLVRAVEGALPLPVELRLP